LAAPVIVIAVIVVIPVAHALVVLTVSHVLPLFQPCVKSVELLEALNCHFGGGPGRSGAHASGASVHDAAPIRAAFVNVAFNKHAFPTRQRLSPANLIQPAKTGSVFLRKSSSAIAGFRSLCGRKQRKLTRPLRSIGPAFWNL
jgi:hypothetical protein